MRTANTALKQVVGTFPVLLLALTCFAGELQAQAANPSAYKDSKSVFTIYRDPSDPAKLAREPGCGGGRVRELSANASVIEFAESGSFVDDNQLKLALDCISQARQQSPSGVVVIVFVHGWRHDSSWDDENFRDFRNVLLSLALREAERFGGAYRRVIGIYIGWPGGRITEFDKRYETAQRIGRSSAMKQAIHDIVRKTKEVSPNERLGSPLILAGHSMGALMLQTAFSALLDSGDLGSLAASPAEQQRCSMVRDGNRAVVFPDLVLLLNSATDSGITKHIVDQLRARRLSKTVACGGTPFRGPLFISASAKSDYATEWLFWGARLGRSITDGNDDDLINHRLLREGGSLCPGIRGVRDFGQSWHCLRQPDIRNDQVASVRIDLPQTDHPRDDCHVRYRFERYQTAGDSPFWVFQVPKELMDGHSDIFNGQSSLLIMALIQMSGATMSVHSSYGAMFEPEVGSCSLP